MIGIGQEPIIRVGILAASEIQFELKGNFLADGNIVPPGIYTASVENGTVVCSLPGIELFPENPSSTFMLKNVTIGIGFHWEQQECQEFEGGLTLQIEGDCIRAVNTVPLESYLKSVISSEMSAMNDQNLLNAHAIVSRSWLLAQIQNSERSHLNSFTRTETEIVKWYDREDHATFDVCADDHCQRYQGITKVISDKAQKAIEDTRGQVLVYGDEICDARFSKCCGGISEDFENVWQPVKVPYLVAVRDMEPKMFQHTVHFQNEEFITTNHDAFCNTSDPEILSQVLIEFDRSTTNFYRWRVEYTQHEIARLIGKKSGIDFGEIIDLLPLDRGSSGRIIRLQIIGSKHELIVGKELEIRKWLSESHLFSSAFVVDKEFKSGIDVPSKFILHGAGWGHGVGMCQIGAAVMSRKGFNPTRILEHYFRGASIKMIY
jgi:SpoIID/LytB domain protein